MQKVGVVPFTLDGLASGYVAAVLGHEHGIGVRSGCFCAQPYVAHLLSLQPTEMLGAAATGGVDGMVRISLGGYSDTGDVDRVVDAVQRVTAGAVRSSYCKRARRLLGARPTNPPDLAARTATRRRTSPSPVGPRITSSRTTGPAPRSGSEPGPPDEVCEPDAWLIGLCGR